MAGLNALEQAHRERQARKEASDGNFIVYAKFPNGHPYQVRFLEQNDDVNWAYVHELPLKPGQIVAKVTPCLNQDGEAGQACPGCENGSQRKIKGWINLIMRNAPVYQKDENGRMYVDPLTKQGKVVGTADQVQVWNGGPTIFTALATKDRTFKGLMSRDFTIIRSGEKFSTAYSIEPTDADGGPQPLSAADKELMDSKPNLKPFVTPEDYDTTRQLLMGVPREAIQAQQTAVSQAQDTDYFEEAMRKAREGN